MRYRQEFQSTLPAWGATIGCYTNGSTVVFQSTLPAWGATDQFRSAFRQVPISIHAPRVGSDEARGCYYRRPHDFNPRSPRGERRTFLLMARGSHHFNPRSPRGERLYRLASGNLYRISIHAPRVGSDSTFIDISGFCKFQSTLPAWGATNAAIYFDLNAAISIHAPRVGSDLGQWWLIR